MSEISITIKGVDGETATLTAPSDLPLSSVTSSIQSALEKCSASAVRRKAWAENVAGNVAPNWDLDRMGTWGAVDGTVVFFPEITVNQGDLEEVSELVEGDRSVIEGANCFKFQAWDDMTDLAKALTLATLLACYAGAMLTVRYPMDFEIGDVKYCPPPGIARELWEKMKGLCK